MPRVIIVVPSVQQTGNTLAEAVADGVARVRFMEVEVRTLSSDAATDDRRLKVLGGVETLGESDAVILTTSAAPNIDTNLGDVLAKAEQLPSHVFTNTVFGVAGDTQAEWLPLVARLGGIVVSMPRVSHDPLERARALGERVATVVEWVRHARSHDHGHAHHHSHH